MRIIAGICFFMGLVSILEGCANAPKFQFKYYALDALNYDGMMRGPTPDDDLTLKLCEPRPGDRAPCTVMSTDDFLMLKAAFKSAEACK